MQDVKPKLMVKRSFHFLRLTISGLHTDEDLAMLEGVYIRGSIASHKITMNFRDAGIRYKHDQNFFRKRLVFWNASDGVQCSDGKRLQSTMIKLLFPLPIQDLDRGH